MFKVIIGGFIVMIIAYILFFVLVIKIANQGAEAIKKTYEKPDTTITIKNGKADTIIIKKSSKWLK